MITLAVGAIIGWGAFILPGDFFIKETGVLNSILGLFLGSLLLLIIQKNYSYIAKKTTLSKGELVDIDIILGKNYSFLAGWFLILSYLSIISLNVVSLNIILGKILGDKIKFLYLYQIQGYPIYLSEILISSVAIIFFALFNLKGLNYSTYLQNIMVLILFSIVFFMGGYILFTPHLDKSLLWQQLEISGNLDINKIYKVLAIAPWAYLGFDTITQLIKKSEISQKKIHILSIIAIMIGFLIYILLILITAINYSPTMLKQNEQWATGSSVEKIFGKTGLYSLMIAVFMAITAGINAFIIATERVFFNMIELKLLKERKELNITRKSIISIMVIVTILVSWFGRNVLLWLTDISALGVVVIYLLVSLSALKLSYKEKKKIGLLFGIVGMGIAAFFCILLFKNKLEYQSYLVIIIWCLIGLVIDKIIKIIR